MLDRASRRHSHIVRRQRDQKDGDFLAFKSPLACLFRFLVPPHDGRPRSNTTPRAHQELDGRRSRHYVVLYRSTCKRGVRR